MNAFETFLLDFFKAAVATAPSILPIFVHSPNGIAVLNASEEFAGALTQQLAQPPATPTK